MGCAGEIRQALRLAPRIDSGTRLKSMNVDSETEVKRKRLGKWLAAVFMMVMILGPGPGLRLVNPDPAGTDKDAFFVGGLPIIYAWGLLWFAVQILIILVAYKKIWVFDTGADPDPDRDGNGFGGRGKPGTRIGSASASRSELESRSSVPDAS